MKEITFLKQNASKWEEYERLAESDETISPPKLTEMFVEITDDLSYSNTNYGPTNTSAYVNGVASRVHQLVYKNKRESNNRFITFYTRELPLLFGRYHHYLLYAFIFMAVAACIGVFSQLYDENFVRMVLGDYYVDSTIDRIRHGDPLGIYGEDNQFLMFVQITLNNIRVTFFVFIVGLFTVFGPALLLLYNGVMLGCFFTLFYQHNVLNKALKVVWIHGTLEISAIIVAGCAGFILGNCYLFPGTYTRLHAFKQGAKNGLKVVIGLLPVFTCAGFLESFVTRYTEMHIALALTIIIFSFLFMLGYFVILPVMLKKKNPMTSD